jgi:hypothetical protein
MADLRVLQWVLKKPKDRSEIRHLSIPPHLLDTDPGAAAPNLIEDHSLPVEE